MTSANEVDIFAEAEEMARKAAAEHDAWEQSPEGRAFRARRVADDIRRGIRDADGHFIEAPEGGGDEAEAEEEEGEEVGQ